MRDSLSTLRWHLHRVIEKMGYIGNAAIALLLSLLLAYLILVLPLQSHVSEAKALSTEQTSSPANVRMTEEEKFEIFEKALPSVDKRATAIQSFMDVAIEEGLQPNEITYKTENRVGDPFSHYHVEFGLYASYPKIQHFLNKLLQQLNYVAIASLTYHRETVKDSNVEARIHLVFHFNRLSAEASSQLRGQER